MRRISVELSESSIDRVIREINEYKEWVHQKTNELLERLAMIGIREASIRFTGAYYDSSTGNDTSLTIIPGQDKYTIVAEGTQVCFVEFGAGVYYNGAEPYPNPPGRPQGIAGIGQYGKGKGTRKMWAYYDDTGELKKTHGTPAAMPMYHASRKIEDELLNIAREVFSH